MGGYAIEVPTLNVAEAAPTSSASSPLGAGRRGELPHPRERRHPELGPGQSEQGPGNYAAFLCASLGYGGYKDWFLPSKDELNAMFQNLQAAGLGSIGSDWYWSSSEYANSNEIVWEQSTFGLTIIDTSNNRIGAVRAARAF